MLRKSGANVVCARTCASASSATRVLSTPVHRGRRTRRRAAESVRVDLTSSACWRRHRLGSCDEAESVGWLCWLGWGRTKPTGRECGGAWGSPGTSGRGRVRGALAWHLETHCEIS